MASAMESNSTNVKMIYQSVLDDVIRNIREAVFDEGYDDHFLKELKTTWESKLHATKTFQHVDAPVVRQHHHPMQYYQQQQPRVQYVIPQSTQIIQQQQQQQMPVSSPMNLLQGGFRVQNNGNRQIINIKNINPNINNNNINNQTDGPNDGSSDEEVDDEAEIKIEVPPDSEDDFDDDDDDDSNKKFDDEDPNPINSGDDITDEETPEIFDTDNVIVCQYEKLTKAKAKWKFSLKNGIMNIDGRDFLFSKATGDADWML